MSTMVVLGMYCREDKKGLFYEAGSKKKKDIWPFIKHFYHSDTSVICSDEAKQYYVVEKFLIRLFIKVQITQRASSFLKQIKVIPLMI